MPAGTDRAELRCRHLTSSFTRFTAQHLVARVWPIFQDATTEASSSTAVIRRPSRGTFTRRCSRRDHRQCAQGEREREAEGFEETYRAADFDGSPGPYATYAYDWMDILLGSSSSMRPTIGTNPSGRSDRSNTTACSARPPSTSGGPHRDRGGHRALHRGRQRVGRLGASSSRRQRQLRRQACHPIDDRAVR